MDLSIVSQFMSLTPDMMYKATKMVETVQSYFPGDVDAQEQYLNENLIDQTLEYALTLLEDKKIRDYMGTAVYTNGTTFSAPTLALYNVASLPEMKRRIQAKLNAKSDVRREEVEIIDEKKRPKLKGRKFKGKNPWWNSDGDDTPYEPGDDVKKTRKEAVDYVAELWRNRHSDDQLDEVKGYGGHVDPNTGKSSGLRSPSQQAHATHWRNRQQGKDVPDPRKSKFKYGGSTGSTTGAHQGEPPEDFAKKQNPDLAMTPANRMKSRATALRARGEGKRANKIDAVRNRPNMGEEFTIEAKNKEGKEQGADGKACWKGYKYAGTENGKDKCVKVEDIDFVADYLISEGLNEYGIDILIEEMGLDDFCDFVDEISEEEFLVEWRRGAGGTKVRGSGMSKSGKSIGSLKGGAKASAIRASAEHKSRKAEREKEGSKSSGMKVALQSQSKIAMAKKSQPATKSTPTQTKEKAKGGILGALKARAEKGIASVGQSVQTLRTVGARRAAEVKATYDAVRAKGQEAEQSPQATRARRRATVATGRAAQAAGRTAIKAAGAAGAAAGQAVVARRSGATIAQAAGRGAGTLVKKLKKEEKELLTHYFIEAEIAFNYDEVHEIFETLDQEHFDYFMEQAVLMVEEAGPSARELIEEKLQNTFDIERFTFADWRQLTEKTSDDTATSKFVSLTQSNRTDNTPDVKGKRKDGVIINPQVDMKREDKDLEAYQKSTQPSIDAVKNTKGKMVNRASASIAANRVERDVKTASKYGPQRQKPGTVGAYRTEEVEHLDERRREDKGTPRPAEPSAAFKLVSKAMGSSRLGVQPRGQKKVPGKKPPVAGEYGGPKSPEQKVAQRRASAQRARDNMSSRFD
jgi:hypothetical protein